MKKYLVDQFGSVDAFKREFEHNALTLFGSGCTWLVEDRNQILRVMNTYNAGNLSPFLPAALLDLMGDTKAIRSFRRIYYLMITIRYRV